MPRVRGILLAGILLCAVVAVFWVRGSGFIDTDFGWRLRQGERILAIGPQTGDPFSYTMPSFPWADHAWLTDAIIAFLYHTVGIRGTAVVFSLFAVGSVLLAARRSIQHKTIEYPSPAKGREGGVFKISAAFSSSFPTILALSIALSLFAIRAQVLSWLILALFVWLILDERLWMRNRWFVPFFIMAWANIHGSVVAGIVILGLVLAFRGWRVGRVGIADTLLFFLSVAGTLVNPYGIGLWREIGMTLTNAAVKVNIDEWRSLLTLPYNEISTLVIIIFMVLSAVVVFRYRRHISAEEHVLFWFFLFYSLVSKRMIINLVIVALPLVLYALRLLRIEASRSERGKIQYARAEKVMWLASVCFFLIQAAPLLGAFPVSSMEKTDYPHQAVEYLTSHPPSGNIFSKYGWGGYVIWQMPEKKVFIDGRMSHWKLDSPSATELPSAFQTYLDILSGREDPVPLFATFHVDTVLWPRETKKTPGVLENIENTLRSLVPFTDEVDEARVLRVVENAGWQKVYEDTVAVIYKKIK